MRDLMARVVLGPQRLKPFRTALACSLKGLFARAVGNKFAAGVFCETETRRKDVDQAAVERLDDIMAALAAQFVDRLLGFQVPAREKLINRVKKAFEVVCGCLGQALASGCCQRAI